MPCLSFISNTTSQESYCCGNDACKTKPTHVMYGKASLVWGRKNNRIRNVPTLLPREVASNYGFATYVRGLMGSDMLEGNRGRVRSLLSSCQPPLPDRAAALQRSTAYHTQYRFS